MSVWPGQVPNRRERTNQYVNKENYGDKWEFQDPYSDRDSSKFSGFYVSHEIGQYLQTQENNTLSHTSETNKGVSYFHEPGMLPFSMATYPTVKFTIIGYPADFTLKSDLGSDDTIVLST